jgi:hypothetical protein
MSWKAQAVEKTYGVFAVHVAVYHPGWKTSCCNELFLRHASLFLGLCSNIAQSTCFLGLQNLTTNGVMAFRNW